MAINPHEQAAANALGRQWDINKPILEDGISHLQGQTGNYDLVNRAQLNTMRGFDQAAHGQQLQNSRYGLGVTPDQQRAMDRTRALGMASGVANAKNQTRLGVLDRDIGINTGLMNSLQGLQSGGTEGLVQAGQIESQRNQSNANIRASNQAQKHQNKMGALGMLISAASLFKW